MDRWYLGYITGAAVVLVTLALTDSLYARDAARELRRAAAWLDRRADRLELENPEMARGVPLVEATA